MLLVVFPSLHADVVCGILHLCTQSSRRLFLGAQVFSNDDKHTARCAMAVGTQRSYWFGKTRLKLELGFYVATTLKQYVGDQQLKFWCIQNVGSLQKHENLAFCWFLTSFSAAARASGASRRPPQQTRTVVYSRDTVRVYIRYAYLYAVFSNPGGAEPTVYIAHPTHGAGTRPKRKQLTTAARKTTLNAGQCVRQPREGRGRNRQTPPKKKNKKTTEGGGGGGAKKTHSHPNRPPTPSEAAKPPPEGTEDRTPKKAQGDHPAKTGNTKPETAAHQEKGHRNKQTHTTKKKKRKKKKRASNPAREKGDGGTGTTRPGTGTPSKKKKKKKRKKNTPTTQPRRAGHSRDPGPAHTPTPHARTGNGGGQAGRPRNHTHPISRPKPNPNHEHHRQPTLEVQHHRPCPNTPTQDPSQDWRG